MRKRLGKRLCFLLLSLIGLARAAAPSPPESPTFESSEEESLSPPPEEEVNLLEPALPSPSAPTPARPSTASATEVRLIAIGHALPLSDLSDALGSDIFDGLTLTTQTAPRFDPHLFLRAPDPETRSIDVWVDATDRRNVRLYFSDPQNSRYFLRDLRLSGSMDEMDREALAQAISFSLRALVSASPGTLTRKEVHSRLNPEAEGSEPSQENESTGSPEGGAFRHAKRSFLTDARGLYRAGLYSPEIPLVHGPGLGVGLFRSGRTSLLGLDANVQYQLPAHHEKDGLELELRSLASRLQAQMLRPVTARFAFGAEMGGGFDVVWAAPSALSGIDVEARDSSTSFAAVFSVGLYVEMKVARLLALDLHLNAEFDALAPEFFIATGQEEELFVGRYPLRPTFTLGFGFL